MSTSQTQIQTQQQNSGVIASKSATIIKQSPSSSSLIQQQQDFVMVNNEDPASNSELSQGKQTLAPQTQQQAQIPSTPAASSASSNDEEVHLNKLRQLLGAGQRTDAIDLAIKHNMWPHALFLASSFGNFAINNSAAMNQTASSASTISSAAAAAAAQQQSEPKLLQKVKIRFINSLQPNDPIQTCYQLLIGRVPTIASVRTKKILINNFLTF